MYLLILFCAFVLTHIPTLSASDMEMEQAGQVVFSQCYCKLRELNSLHFISPTSLTTTPPVQGGNVLHNRQCFGENMTESLLLLPILTFSCYNHSKTIIFQIITVRGTSKCCKCCLGFLQKLSDYSCKWKKVGNLLFFSYVRSDLDLFWGIVLLEAAHVEDLILIVFQFKHLNHTQSAVLTRGAKERITYPIMLCILQPPFKQQKEDSGMNQCTSQTTNNTNIWESVGIVSVTRFTSFSLSEAIRRRKKAEGSGARYKCSETKAK